MGLNNLAVYNGIAMPAEKRVLTKVLPGKRVEFPLPEFEEGEEVEVIVSRRFERLSPAERRERLIADLEIGIEQIRRGECFEYSHGAEIAADVIRRGKAHLAENARSDD
jgi:hypothetical protein